MESITSFSAQIHFNYLGYEAFEYHLKKSNYSSLFILVDENTREHCLPKFLASVGGSYDFEIIEIESGEIDVKQLVTHTYSISDSQKAFDHARSGESAMKIIITK